MIDHVLQLQYIYTMEQQSYQNISEICLQTIHMTECIICTSGQTYTLDYAYFVVLFDVGLV